MKGDLAIMRKKDFRLKIRKDSKYWSYKMPYMSSFLTTEIVVNFDNLEQSEQEAEQWVNDNIINETKSKPKFIGYDEFIKDKKYFKGFKGNRANQKMREGHLKNYIKPFLHNKNLLKVTALDIENFQEYLKKKGLSLQTVQHITVTLRQLFYPLLKAGLIITSPVFKPERNEGDILPKEKEALTVADLTKLFPFPLDENKKIIEADLIDSWSNIYGCFEYGVYCYLLLTTGARRNEIISIKPKHIVYLDQVDAYSIVLNEVLKSDGSIGAPKNNEIRFLYLMDRAYEVLKILLDRLPDSSPDAFIFTGRKPNTCIDPSQMSKIVKKAFIKAGLFKDNPDRFISLHSFRHSFVSFVANYLPASHGQVLSGQKSLDVFEDYKTLMAKEKISNIGRQGQLKLVDKAFDFLGTNEAQ